MKLKMEYFNIHSVLFFFCLIAYDVTVIDIDLHSSTFASTLDLYSRPGKLWDLDGKDIFGKCIHMSEVLPLCTKCQSHCPCFLLEKHQETINDILPLPITGRAQCSQRPKQISGKTITKV